MRRTGIFVVLLMLVAPLLGAAPRQYAWLRAPDGRGRPFDLASLRGQIVALTFASRNTRDEVSDINDELQKHVVPGAVSVVTVVDLVNVPHYGYGMARKKIAEAEKPGFHNVVDERGALARSFGVDPLRQVDILVIGRDGQLLGRFVGEKGVDEAIALIDRAR